MIVLARRMAGAGGWLAVVAATSTAHALVISNEPTQNVNCSDGMCIASAADAVLNVADIENYLQAGSLTISGNDAAVKIDAPLAWNTPNSLTITAPYGAVIVNRRVSVDGKGELTFNYNIDYASSLQFGQHGRIRFKTSTSHLFINGISYVLAGTIADLAHAAVKKDASYVALMDDYDASGDGTYSTSPIKTASTVEGLGNHIANVTIDDTASIAPGPLGLFGNVSSVRHLHVVDINVTANASTGDVVGGLAGTASDLEYDDVTGTVSAAGLTAGGLAGYLNGSITSSSAHVQVTGAIAGGLVGDGGNSSIGDSSATGSVTATNGTAGGLVGHMNGGQIVYSFASGDVRAPSGEQLVGGGLVGAAEGSISIDACYASGSVSAQSGMLGGLVGLLSDGRIATSYAIGIVGSALGGGLVGQSDYSQNTADYWDVTASGNDVGVADGSQSGVVGLTTTQFKTGLPAGFVHAVWAEHPTVNGGYPYLIDNPPPS